ncbi:MAG: hypothetical protein WA966_12450, partial [Ornithinimicrobium sp.]
MPSNSTMVRCGSGSGRPQTCITHRARASPADSIRPSARSARRAPRRSTASAQASPGSAAPAIGTDHVDQVVDAEHGYAEDRQRAVVAERDTRLIVEATTTCGVTPMAQSWLTAAT